MDAATGKLQTLQDLRAFALGGNAYFTIRSKRTNTRYTYRLRQPKKRLTLHSEAEVLFASVLTGADNTSSYSYIGAVWHTPALNSWKLMRKAKPSPYYSRAPAPSVAALEWLLGVLGTGRADLFERCEVWHEGRCGRCGRKLTVPESIASGFGPECAGKVNH
jgi:Family of unknown function (DUF6011)